MTLHSPTENSLAVFNHKILEANSQVQNVKLGGHQTCLSINRLWHELCDMLRRLVGTTAPGHHDCSIQEWKNCHGWLGCSPIWTSIFDDFFHHLWPYIGNNTANVVFQMVKRLWLIRIDQ
ncbi:uncharacterized protein TNCV_4076501 [Trichonephila clavipes]|nr:uncharacterized protein TNCV_4076501 [Trichonephila clavipes]